MTDALDITASQRKIILGLLKRYLPNVTVWVYGSRIKWTSRPQSDLDMVAFASPEQKRRASDLKEALEESDLPFRVDLFIWDEVPEQFRKNIEAGHVVFQEKAEVEVVSDWSAMDFGEAFEVPPQRKIARGENAPFVAMDMLPTNARSLDGYGERVFKGSGTRFKNGDTLLARITPCLENGKTAYVKSLPDNTTAHGSTEFIVISGKKRISDNLFAYYVTRTPHFRTYAIGHMEGTSGRQRVPATSIKKYQLPLPPLPEQKRIAAVLGALDNKIELNRKMNKTLEDMAQAIFKSWFVDSDSISPEDLMDSELGLIPKGWEVGSPSSLVEFNPKLSLKKGALARCVDMKALSTDSMAISGWIEKEFKGGSKFQQGDTLLARITPCLENGKTGYVSFLDVGEVAFGSTEFIVMRGKEGVPPEWVYCLARSPEFREHAISNMTGSSGRQRVPVNCFGHFSMAIPLLSRLGEFGAIAKPLFDRIALNLSEMTSLTELRDTLLPKLISGEVRVPDIEGIEEELIA